MATTKHKLEFAVAMSRHTRATVRQIEALMRYASTLQRLAEKACNEVFTDADDRKQLSIEEKVKKLCEEMREGHSYPAPVPVFSGDPRGCVLKIRVPDGFSDDMGGEGICVPS